MRTRSWIPALLTTALAAATVPSALAQSSPATALVNAQIVSLADAPTIANGVIVVRDGLIEAVGAAESVAVPADARRIDVEGSYVMPGLIDAHVHLRKANVLRLYAARGFTTVRDMNGNLSKTLAAREIVGAGEIVGARLLAASPTMLSSPFRDYPAPATAEAGRATARRLQSTGYDLIKVFRVQRDGFFGVMEEAVQLGIPVAGHVPDVGLDDPDVESQLSFEDVLGSGMSSLEHILEVAEHGMGSADALDRLPSVAAAVARAGIPITTLAYAALVNNETKTDREGFVERHRAEVERLLGERGIEAIRGINTDPWTVVPEAVVHRIILTFHKAGVRLIVGTDSHFASLLAGDAGLREIELLVAAGLSRRDALRAATVEAAAAIGLGERIGRIAVGLTADLLVLRDDPLEELGALRSPAGVMLAGRWLDADDLEVLIEAAIVEGLA